MTDLVDTKAMIASAKLAFGHLTDDPLTLLALRVSQLDRLARSRLAANTNLFMQAKCNELIDFDEDSLAVTQKSHDTRTLLDALDAFMSGAPLTIDQNEAQKAAGVAGCFAAVAYESAPSGGPDIHALTRAFLMALIDPLDPSLDYLRADPAAGVAAREAAAQFSKITQS